MYVASIRYYTYKNEIIFTDPKASFLTVVHCFKSTLVQQFRTLQKNCSKYFSTFKKTGDIANA